MKHIIRQSELGEIAERRLAHPLNPEAVRRSRSLGDTAGLTMIGVHLNVVAPGTMTTELHRHAHADEFVYVVSGHAVVQLDEEQYEVGPGDFIGMPANGPAHTMRNSGDTDLVYLIVGNRTSFDVVDYPRLHKRLYLTRGAEGRRFDFVDCEDVDSRHG